LSGPLRTATSACSVVRMSAKWPMSLSSTAILSGMVGDSLMVSTASGKSSTAVAPVSDPVGAVAVESSTSTAELSLSDSFWTEFWSAVVSWSAVQERSSGGCDVKPRLSSVLCWASVFDFFQLFLCVLKRRIYDDTWWKFCSL
jgi:hypothetical protein